MNTSLLKHGRPVMALSVAPVPEFLGRLGFDEVLTMRPATAKDLAARVLDDACQHHLVYYDRGGFSVICYNVHLEDADSAFEFGAQAHVIKAWRAHTKYGAFKNLQLQKLWWVYSLQARCYLCSEFTRLTITGPKPLALHHEELDRSYQV